MRQTLEAVGIVVATVAALWLVAGVQRGPDEQFKRERDAWSNVSQEHFRKYVAKAAVVLLLRRGGAMSMDDVRRRHQVATTRYTNGLGYVVGDVTWQCTCGARGVGNGHAHMADVGRVDMDRACWDALREANGVT